MIRSLSSRAGLGALLLTGFACSGGGGGGGGQQTADIQTAQNLAGVWEFTITVKETDCPGLTVGDEDTVSLFVTTTPGSAAVELQPLREEFVAQGGGDPVSQGKQLEPEPAITGRIDGDRLTARRDFNGSIVEIEFGTFSTDSRGRLAFGTGTARSVESDPMPCTTVYDVIGRLDGAVVRTQELAGTWRYEIEQVVGSMTSNQVAVGDTGTFVVRPDAVFSDRFTGALIEGPVLGSFQQMPIPDLGLTVTATSRGIGVGDALPVSSPPPPPATFEIRFDNGASATAQAMQISITDGTETMILAGKRTRIDSTLAVAGNWTFDVDGEVLSGDLAQTGSAVALNDGDQFLRGTVAANGELLGVVRVAQQGEGLVTGAFDATAGTFDGSSWVGPVSGTRIGGGGGGGTCTTIQTGTWNIDSNSGAALEGGTMTQDGCTVTFVFEVPGVPELTTTLSGTLDGSRWMPTVTGALQGVLADIDVTFSGQPATSFSGTATDGGASIVLTGARQ